MKLAAIVGKTATKSGGWAVKAAKGSAKAVKEIVYRALVLYYCLQDPDTPAWAKTVIMGALGYFILPADAVPDVIPGIGKSDDLIILAAASALVLVSIKAEHKRLAREKVKELFGDGDDASAD